MLFPLARALRLPGFLSELSGYRLRLGALSMDFKASSNTCASS